MKLQLALDTLTLEDALTLTESVKDTVDRIEIGTPFLLEYGMEAVRRFRAQFPDKELLADTKIMDAGELEAGSAFRAGADFVTVLAVTDDATIRTCVAAARVAGRKVIADMMCVEDLGAKVRVLEALGVDGVAVHTGVDQQKSGRTPLADLKVIKAHAQTCEVSVAGGISRETLGEYRSVNPDVIIVGGAIANAGDPAGEARALYQAAHA